MSARRVRIDLSDGEGNKITVTFQGRITRSKVLQLLDFLELLGGVPEEVPKTVADLSKFEKLRSLVERKFPVGWFTSQEVMIAYEDAYDEPIGLSTVSTYLSRLASREVLTRGGSAAGRRYKLRRSVRRERVEP